MAINIDKDSDFSLDNLPFGIFTYQGSRKQVGIALGNLIVNLNALVSEKVIVGVPIHCLEKGVLNPFISLGKKTTNHVREQIRALLTKEVDLSPFLIEASKAELHIPIFVGDYTDFYSSEEHAVNVGKLYRDPENALMPNWKHLPVGYHGRASTVVVSGTPVVRPMGQVKPNSEDLPSFVKTKALDFELETGFIIGKENALGSSVSTDEAEEYIFGMVLLNDWSARDIQKWEYVPLGPFLGKNFATSISPWVIPYEALKPFMVAGPKQDPEVLDYLKYSGNKNIDLNLEVKINNSVVSRSNFKYMYWNMEQQLAHHTCNGCQVKVGDLMGSGTISGMDEKSYGSLLEITRGGKKELVLKDGTTRTFLEDGDEVSMSGYCEKKGRRVGFGSVTGKIMG